MPIPRAMEATAPPALTSDHFGYFCFLECGLDAAEIASGCTLLHVHDTGGKEVHSENLVQSPRRLFRLEPAAAYLSISPRNLRALVSSGSIPVIRVSARRIAFDQEDLDAYIAQQRS